MAHNITTRRCVYSGWGLIPGLGTSICCSCSHLFEKKKKKNIALRNVNTKEATEWIWDRKFREVGGKTRRREWGHRNQGRRASEVQQCCRNTDAMRNKKSPLVLATRKSRGFLWVWQQFHGGREWADDSVSRLYGRWEGSGGCESRWFFSETWLHLH